ncbi:sterol desaturase family protein [Yoonia sp. SS1-5]|uniref:Sterol desaturase family protein n=1 Tax=Yoonia rhodophyticola TaxID=3137370 RepID=A0AAN0M6Q8_9RHOB
MIVIAAIIFVRKKPADRFWAWVFPKKVYLHPSHFVDIKLFVIGRVFALVGLFQLVTFSSLIAALIISNLGVAGFGLALHPIVATFLFVLATDFAVYWVHRIHHEHPFFWPFHSVHHSAEVMTPVTVYRKHPVYDIFSNILKSICIGTTQGLLVAAFTGDMSLTTIFGANAFYFLFNMLGSNLRHTHIWLSYGRVLEHVFISPAQHQIHHSIERRHYNKNYGEVFAFWDWMFGTLYVPQEEEIIRFGLGDMAGQRIEQPHPSLKDALLVPFKDAFGVISRNSRTASEPKADIKE